MTFAKKHPCAAATAAGAGKIKHELAEFAACNTRNQDTLARAFGIEARDRHRTQMLAALKRRCIFARHDRVCVPLVPGSDLYGAALEVAPDGSAHEDSVAVLVADRANACAGFEVGELTPWLDADFIGRLLPEHGSLRVCASVNDWLRQFQFVASGLPDGRWRCWPTSILLLSISERALWRFGWRVAGSGWRIQLTVDDERHRRLADRLQRLSSAPSPTFVCGREVRS